MKAIQIFILIIIVTIQFGYGQSQIPQVINVSGSSFQNNGYYVEWSIGELAFVNQMTSADNSYILTNGFIQPDSMRKSLPGSIGFNSANIKIFPNPTDDLLEINFYQINAGKISIQLSNELGQVVYTHEVLVHGSGLVEKINMKGFTNGVYMLYIKRLNPVSGRYDTESGSYKIIKQ